MFVKWSFTSLLTKQTRFTFSGTASLWAQSAFIELWDWSNLRSLQRKIQRKWSVARVQIVQPVVSWCLFWKVTSIYYVLFHYFVVKCLCLYKCFTIYSSVENGCPYFSLKLFTETNILTFKQFISVSYKMCWMENYAPGFANYKYKTLISFKIYVILHQC